MGAGTVDRERLWDAVGTRGWDLERLQKPPNLHLVVTPAHEQAATPFLADLREAAQEVSTKEPGSGGTAAMYGMLEALPDREGVHKVILDFVEGMTRLEES